MALFELMQETGAPPEQKKAETFKECAAADVDSVFFCLDEFASLHGIDGRDVPVVLEENTLGAHSAHWEAGAKQNFDTGLYTALTILYIKAADYGPRPKVEKQLVIDGKRLYTIQKCEEEAGVYRMTLKRTRQ